MYKSEKIKIGEWEVSDLPRRCSLKDYEEVRQEIIEKVGSVPGVISILEWGTVHHPGIADMDFFVIFDREALSMNIPSSIGLSKKAFYLLPHRFLVISEKFYSDLLYLVPWTANKYPGGIPAIFKKKEIHFKELNLSKKEDDFLELTCLYERNEQVFRLIGNLINKTLPIRALFEGLKILDRCIVQTNARFSIKLKTDFCERFKKLEDNWFKIKLNDGVSEMAELLKEGIKMAFYISFALGEYLKDKVDYFDISETKIQSTKRRCMTILDKRANNLYCNSAIYSRLFTDLPLNPEEALKHSLQLYNEYKLPLRTNIAISAPIIQPLLCSFYLTTVVQGHGLYSDRLRRDLFYSGKRIPLLKSQALAKRVSVLNDMVKLYSNKHGENTFGKGYIYGANFFNYNYQSEKLRRKFLLKYLQRKYFSKINQLAKKL